MKNLLKRSMAFMLVACMLLSVVPASVFAVAFEEADNSYTYSWALPEGVTETNVRPAELGLTYGDFVDWARSGASFKQFSAYAQMMSFNNSNGQAYIAFKFTVEKDGYYDVAIDLQTPGTDQVVNAYVVPAADLVKETNNEANNAYVAGLTDPLVLSSETSTEESKTITGKLLYAGDYAVVFSAASSAGSHLKFYGLNLTKTADAPPPEGEAPETQEVTLPYSFVSGDGNVYNNRADSTSSETDLPMSSGMSFDNGSWSFLAGSNGTGGAMVTTSYLAGNISSASRYYAVKLYGIPANGGTAELTFTTASGHSAVSDVYILPGNTESIVTDSLEDGDKLGTLPAHSTSATTVLNATIAPEYVSENSVVLVFRGTGTGTNLRCASLQMKVTYSTAPAPVVPTGDEYDFSINGLPEGHTQAVSGNVPSPYVGTNWTIYKTTYYNGKAQSTSFQANGFGDTTGSRFVIEIDNAAAGIYSLSFQALGNNAGGAANVYLTTTAPEDGWTDANIRAFDVTTATSLGMLDSHNSSSKVLEVASQMLPEGKVYFVFQGSTSGAHGAAGHFRIASLSTTYVEALPDTYYADAVEALIAAIGEVTLESEDAILAARAAFDELTEAQQALVENRDTLTTAEAALEELKNGDPEADQRAADAVIALIDAIGEVTVNSETAINDARTAFDALSRTQQGMVANVQTLLDAEAALAVLKQQAAVDDVIAKIDAIGTVTADSEDAISAARAAYNALSAAQKDLVTNYQTLEDAEEALFNLNNPNPDPDTFDGFVYDFYDAVALLDVANGSHAGFTSSVLSDAYANGELNYIFYAASRTPYVNNHKYMNGAGVLLQGYAQDWFAVKIKSPGIGTYRFNFTYPAVFSANYSQKLDAYMLPISVITAAKEAAGAEATEASVISALLADTDFKKEYIAASKNIKKATNSGAADEDDFWGTVEITSDDEEYVVIFYAAQNKAGSSDSSLQDSKNNVWIAISGFNLGAPPSSNDVAAAEAVMEQIAGIGTVLRSSGDKIAAARAAYNALTAKQKELVENLAILEAAEARWAELTDPANPIEYIYILGDNPTGKNGYPAEIGLTYGDFTDYARNGTFKPYALYTQTQTSFLKGNWLGMKFTVDKAGDYDMTLNLNAVKNNATTLDVYFVRASELIKGNGNTKNQAFIDGIASTDYKLYQVDLADNSTWNLTGVQLDADEYVIVMINTSGYSVQISDTEKETYNTMFNFSGFAITRTGDYTGPEKVIEQPQPVPNTDKLVYDFYYGGASNSTKIFDETYLELINNDFALNKVNWAPVADKLNTVMGGTLTSVYVNGTTDKYPWTGIATSSTVGEWLALKIKAPGTGTYDLVLDHGKNVNGTTVAKAYMIPVSALKDTSAASIEAAIADDTYKLTSTVSFKSADTKTATTELGQVEFEVGKDYILVFLASTNKHGTEKTIESNGGLYEAHILPSKLTATKFVAPDPLNQKEVVYDFHRPDMTESSNVFADGPLGTMTNEYVKGISYWKPYATTVGTVLETFTGKAVYLNGGAKSYKYEAIMINSLPGEWIGFQIKSPGKGLYTISLTYGLTTNGSNDGEVHVIPLDKLGNGTNEDIQKAIDSGDYKLQRDVNYKTGYADNKYKTSKIGQVNFEYGEEYIVVFRARTNKHGGEGILQTNKTTGKQTAYQAFMILQEMKLTYATKVETFEEEEEVLPDVTGQSDPEAAAAVDALIDAIGSEITLDSSNAISAARAAYDLLTDNQKKLVTKYQVLVDAEAKLAELVSADDKAKAEAVIAKIDAIGSEITLESESAIVAARIAYTLLTNSQRALVTNYSVLLAAEAKLAELKGTNSGSALDQASADAVETLISKIGTVTLESEGAISAARNAYNALTATQKLLVENYDVLVAAEKALAELKAEQQAAQDAEEAAKRKAQQITIMIVAAVVAAAAAGVVTVFAVPSIRAKVLAMFAKNKKKV